MGLAGSNSKWWQERQPSRLSIVAVVVCAGVVFHFYLSQLLSSDSLAAAYGLLAILSILACIGCRSGKRQSEDVAGPESVGRILHCCAYVAAISLLLSVTCLWALWRSQSDNPVPANGLSIGQSVEISGQIAIQQIVPRPAEDEQELWDAIPRGDKQTLYLRDCRVMLERRWQPLQGQTVVYLEDRKNRLPDQPMRLASVNVGDRVQIKGTYRWPAAPHNPGQFDIRRWLLDSGIQAQLNVKSSHDISLIESAGLWTSWGDRLKNHFRQSVMRFVPEEQQDMAAAILLGDRSLLNQRQKQKYAATGTIHILAISGLHVGILAGVFFGLGRILGFSRWKIFASVIFLVLFYAWLVDYRAPIVRAAALTTVFCFAGLVRRRIFSLNSLAAAILVVFVLQPSQLLSPGTHLSFLAVGSIVLLHRFGTGKQLTPLEVLRKKQLGQRERWWREKGSIVYQWYRYSAAIFFICLPMVIHQFHLAAWIGLLINPVVILVMTITLVCGFLMLFTSSWFPWAADWFGWLCGISLNWIDQIVSGAQQIPGSHQYLASPGILWTLVWYGMLFLAIWYLGSGVRLRTLLPTFAVLFLLFRFLAIPAFPDRVGNLPQLTVTFVDVGHGNATILRTPEGKVIVCDAGSFPNSNSAIQRICGVLWSHGIDHVDQLVISHADLDHYNAVPELLDRFSVEEVIYPRKMFPGDGSEKVAALQKAIRDSEVRVREVSAGDSLTESASLRDSDRTSALLDSDFAIQVLGPPADTEWLDDNTNSMVLKIRYGGNDVLLTGDLDKQGIDYVLSTTDGRATIVQVPHHGSRKNDPERFSRWANAKYAVISALEKRVQWDVVEIYQSEGAMVLIPNCEGATLFNLWQDGNVEMKQWDSEPWPIR